MKAETDKPAFLADLLAAVGEPTRLRIMNLLHVQPLCVCDLQSVLGLSEPMVSRHLARLRFAHLVTANRNGNRMVYRVNAADSPAIIVLRRFLIEVCRKEPCLQKDLDTLRRCPQCARLQSEQPAVAATKRR
jgi:ArsR family transcriptional regulator